MAEGHGKTIERIVLPCRKRRTREANTVRQFSKLSCRVYIQKIRKSGKTMIEIVLPHGK